MIEWYGIESLPYGEEVLLCDITSGAMITGSYDVSSVCHDGYYYDWNYGVFPLVGLSWLQFAPTHWAEKPKLPVDKLSTT